MLTDEQIAGLFAFCEKHLVRHYDLQVELVDHLANAIESKMAADKTLSFDKALQQVYDSFGVMGFGRLVGTSSAALQKKYSRLRNRQFRGYFSWPLVAKTACGFFALLLLGRLLPPAYLGIAGTMLFVIVCLVELMFNRRAVRLVKRQAKPLLLTQTIYNLSWMGSIFFLFALPDEFSYQYEWSDAVNRIVFCIKMVILALFFLSSLAFNKVTDEIIAKAKRDFPEAFA